MLTQLSTVKTRLALTVTDYDAILTNALKAVSDRFDKETNRTLAPPPPAPERALPTILHPALITYGLRRVVKSGPPSRSLAKCNVSAPLAT